MVVPSFSGTPITSWLKSVAYRLHGKKALGLTTQITGYPVNVGGQWVMFDISDMTDFRSVRHTLNTESDSLDYFQRSVRDGDLVLDVGANHGVFSRIALQLGCSVVAVEASPENIPYLTNRLSGYTGSENHTIVNAAVAATNGRVTLDVSGEGQEHSIGEGKNSVEVDSRTLDSITNEREKAPDIVKIDVEGAENEVVQGGHETLQSARVILCEIHKNKIADLGGDPNYVTDKFSEWGFSVDTLGDLTERSYMIAARP